MKFRLQLLGLLGLALGGDAFADRSEDILARVAAIHGNPGVFAVAGYRMGERALQELGLPRGSFQLRVIHHTPLKVQYSCIADGWQAATGVSAGKLNLQLVEAEALFTEVEDANTHRQLKFELKPEFLRRYLNTPFAEQARAAREVVELSDDQIFLLVPSPQPER